MIVYAVFKWRVFRKIVTKLLLSNFDKARFFLVRSLITFFNYFSKYVYLKIVIKYAFFGLKGKFIR